MADMHLPELLLREAVRLGESLCVPIQLTWPIDARRRMITLALDAASPRDIGDLMYIQDELSHALRDYYELHRPGDLESRGAVLADRLTACTRTG
jgi:hypothetical protein